MVFDNGNRRVYDTFKLAFDVVYFFPREKVSEACKKKVRDRDTDFVLLAKV